MSDALTAVSGRLVLGLFTLAAISVAIPLLTFWVDLSSGSFELMSAGQVTLHLSLILTGVLLSHLKSARLFDLTLAKRLEEFSGVDNALLASHGNAKRLAKWAWWEVLASFISLAVLFLGLFLRSPFIAEAIGVPSHGVPGISLLLCYGAFLALICMTYSRVRRSHLVEQDVLERLHGSDHLQRNLARMDSVSVPMEAMFAFPAPTQFALFQLVLVILSAFSLFGPSLASNEMNEDPWHLNFILVYVLMLMWWLLILRVVTGSANRHLVSIRGGR